jgi:hypothetical protein
MYLGDGHVALVGRKTPFLRIVLDGLYTGIVDECAAALRKTVVGASPCRYDKPFDRGVVLQVASRTNRSAEIREIFCTHCDLLGIKWTQSNPKSISVSHRTSVSKLDDFIGPKT